jgi:hypothetical protein
MDTGMMPTALIENKLDSMATAIVEALRQAGSQAQKAMSDSVKTLHRVEEVAKSLSSAQDELRKMLVTETAAASAARRELWDEAAKFRKAVYREIRWFIRLPAILLVILTIAFTTWFLLSPSHTAPTSLERPAAAPRQTQKPPPAPPAASRLSNRPR